MQKMLGLALPDDTNLVTGKILWDGKHSSHVTRYNWPKKVCPVIRLKDHLGRKFFFEFKVIELNGSLQPAWHVSEESINLVRYIQTMNDGHTNIMQHLIPHIQDLIRQVMRRNPRETCFGMYAFDRMRRDMYASWTDLHPDYIAFTGLYPGILWVRRDHQSKIEIEIQRHQMCRNTYPEAKVHGL